ncbi:GTP-binding protein [Acidithiobacillus sp. CV18-2]|uniref:phospholipase D n=1 Tax=Igneacidithiobacillus copahuensis TaxID=2724909 RepID=A0AAE2YNZ2_9PROT|nr:phospholipase D-like domain-containing protein [Igneacidithiobacillus copahuensis]MBU2753457.1 GTP-binding protein [Acidithiobacillus sp. CV18-3]MBU2756680.1 GTP-binding protein [Acidithiobacillus sp. BN09-2]MBU2776502.1 GTP-binding protein [Acidithiobacillus sp. CV18-2]MBU2797660.1 GTP-binding protein [Acidithiobacillus sp. VAN18-2]MBU2800607.1 GTP-binding protein [Acidithiobacillus sp. VAN18-4]UTV80840.1 phospholipase D-like domain-containing protein [Acidithiobacillus sp. YTS05]
MLYIEPQAGPAPLVQIVDQAKHQVDVGVYYLSDRKLLDALTAAALRGVQVRVIIDSKPYHMRPWQVHKEEREIRATGAELHWAPYRFTSHGDQYAFYHAKYLCNDTECEIGTANFSWSAFHHNREYLWVTHDPVLVRAVHAVFAADWEQRRAPAFTHRDLVLSPGTSVQQLLEIIQQPGPLDVESEELGKYSPVLDALAAKGADLRLILPATLSAEDRENVAFLRAHACQVRFLPEKPVYLHAKMMVGARLAFVGSENVSETSLQKNREMGVVLRDEALSVLRAQFVADWAQASTEMPKGGSA